MQTRNRGRSSVLISRLTGVDPDSTNEALIVAIFLGCCLLSYTGFVLHTAKKSREHPPQHTSLVEYEFPTSFPHVRIMSPRHAGLPQSKFTTARVNCTFQSRQVNTTKFCCLQREPSRRSSRNIDLRKPKHEYGWPYHEQSETEEEEENQSYKRLSSRFNNKKSHQAEIDLEEEEEKSHQAEIEIEEEEESELKQAEIEVEEEEEEGDKNTLHSLEGCIQPPQPINCIGESLSISGLVMNSPEDSLSCDIVIQDSGFAQIDLCVENCEDMQNFGASGTHFLQEGRIDWLEFSSERHTYLSESKPNKHRLQIFQGSLDADVEVLEQRMNFELRAKSDSYLLVSEEDPVHRFDILTSVLAASSFLYMFFNMCFALPIRKRFRCRFNDEAIDYNRLTSALSPTGDGYSEFTGNHVTPIALDRQGEEDHWEDGKYRPPSAHNSPPKTFSVYPSSK